MRRAPSLEDFLADPVGRWLATPSSVVWCASPSLGGATSFGAPDAATTREAMLPLAGLWAETMADQVDVIVDASLLERVDPGAVEAVLSFVVEHREKLARRVRRQIGVVRRGVDGFTLAGILPMAGDGYPFRIVNDPLDAYRVLAGEDGEELFREVGALVADLSQVPAMLRALREVVRARGGAIDLAGAARALGLSSRSLQRSLSAQGTSFQAELREARFAEACAALTTSDEKIASIALRLGISENALTQLFRERAGCTPGEHRRVSRRC